MKPKTRYLAAAVAACLLPGMHAHAATMALSDLPLYSAANVPANLMLALSVEFPTGTTAAYTDLAGNELVYTAADGTSRTITCADKKDGFGVCYFPAMQYMGYFDPAKCYDYDSAGGYFRPVACASPNNGRHWSGNMLNWATMTVLDGFRQSLTGGNRAIDTVTTTVLKRTNLTNLTNTSRFPNKWIGTPNVAATTVVGDARLAGGQVYFSNSKLGSTVLVSNNPGFKNGGKDVTITYNVQVQVCVPGQLEGNCVAYGARAKPEGLIQGNAERIRIGASAYTFLIGTNQPNGQVRALLRDVGPTAYAGNSERVPNPYAEWDKATGVFFQNPAAGDNYAKAPGGVPFTESGAINLLNRFGTPEYEYYDNVSDLYWASLSYLMNRPLHADYFSGMSRTNTMDTAFPVFTTKTNDPMQFSCQANAIVVIGDTHTNCDNRVPSSVSPTTDPRCLKQAPLPPASYGGVDAGAMSTKLGRLPLVEAHQGKPASASMASLFGPGAELGKQRLPGRDYNPTYHIAGLAYYGHTTDLRPDLPGKQTVDTYIVDVLEPGQMDGSKGKELYDPAGFGTLGNKGPSQYWLAAKYGGFADVNDDGIPANPLTWHTNPSSAERKDLHPDNYFLGNRPDLVARGLAQIFSQVSSRTPLSGSGPGVTSTRVLEEVEANAAPFHSPVPGFPIYSTSYAPGPWTGDVVGSIATTNIGEDVTPVPGGRTWSAQGALDGLGAYTEGGVVGWRDLRRIVTFNGTRGVAMRMPNLSSAQAAALRQDGALLDYLRGDRSLEGARFRVRQHLLADVVDSQATLVQGALSPHFDEGANPGYAAFAKRVSSRAPVVYVGANDGMVHAFAADFMATGKATPFAGGHELFAYVPGSMFAGPTGTPDETGLAALANLSGATARPYAHHFYANQTPQAVDVDFGFSATRPGLAVTRDKPDWHTVLVGGLGKGGRSIYALDVTEVPPAVRATKDGEEDRIAQKVLWEFTDADMGYTFARPLVIKTRRYGWVVAVTSGYDNPSGRGTLYILSARTGQVLEKIDTGAGTAATPAGLARPSGYARSVSDATVDQVYAGDLLGNVWMFDVSGGDAFPQAELIARLTDTLGRPQPVTTAPRIEVDIGRDGLSTRRWVFVGTGRFLSTDDLVDTQPQTMYALRDGTAVRPPSHFHPITRADLKVSDLVTDLGLTDADAGWLYDLPGRAPGTGGATERIVVDPDAVAGIYSVSWAGLVPTADPCSLKGAIYSVDYGSGRSVLIGADGKPLDRLETPSAVTQLQMVRLPSGEVTLLYGQTGSQPGTVNIRQPDEGGDVRRTNWREILR